MHATVIALLAKTVQKFCAGNFQLEGTVVPCGSGQ